MPDTRPVWPRRAAFVLAAAFALAIAQSVYRIPIQVSDSLDAILLAKHQSSSLELLQEASRWSSTTLRPMRYIQARWLGSLAEVPGFSYHAVFRGVHALLAAAIVLLLAWIADVRRWTDVAALGFALTVLVGLHTFDAVMRESFPVNHYAEVAAGSLFVLGVALRPARIISQALAVALLIGGLLLIESAGLIWVIIVACAALRLPGIHTRTAVAATLVMAAFLVGRSMLDISSPGIGSHSSGWGGEVLSADDLKSMFVGNPWPFYAYNVVGGALSVLASEPRFGMYQLLAARASGTLSPVVVINLVSSLLVTAVIVACWRSTIRTPFARWTVEHKTLAVGTIAIAVSAVLCANYIKDDIISTAGVFYAVMAYVAARWSIERVGSESPIPATAVALAACLLISAPLWAFRAVGTHYELRHTAFVSRNDWALRSVRELAGGESASDADMSLTSRIRAEELNRRVTSPRFLPDWADRYWVE